MAEGDRSLLRLAAHLGVATRYRDGLGQRVVVRPETLVRVCASLGAPIEHASDAAYALRALQVAEADEMVPPVLVAWDGILDDEPVFAGAASVRARVTQEDGTEVDATSDHGTIGFARRLPPGYHRLRVEARGQQAQSTIISAPVRSWSRGGDRGWGVATHLAALRSARSRALGDLADLANTCDWIGGLGGELVTVLPLLPTFNDDPPEPSPYSPVSRLFWSELVLDLGEGHRPASIDGTLRVDRADAEVRAALADRTSPGPDEIDAELARYARFRGAQRRLGRDWRRWPSAARSGQLDPSLVDEHEERYHLVAQAEVRRQLGELDRRLDGGRVRLGLDLAVGVHPEGYDAWARQDLFAPAMVVGAPPDDGFPSGQSWGFPPVLPHRSRAEGHRYLAASVAHQAAVAGVLRIDHVMAMSRLYWIPEGMDLDAGTYVGYPTDELFAVLCLESHRNRCELVGENLGTVPPEVNEALARHRVRGTYVAQFEVGRTGPVPPPDAGEVAMVGTHDTPTFAGWLTGADIEERVRVGLLSAGDAEHERQARQLATHKLAGQLGVSITRPAEFLERLVEWLAASPAPLVVLWLEDLWLEQEPVNVPGSSPTQRPNWQRPMRRLLDEVIADPAVRARLEALDRARRRPGVRPHRARGQTPRVAGSDPLE